MFISRRPLLLAKFNRTSYKSLTTLFPKTRHGRHEAKNSKSGLPSPSRRSTEFGGLGPSLKYPPEEALPPLVFLQSAAKAGALDISPRAAIDLLLQYQSRQERASKGWEQELCKDFGVEAQTLFLLHLVLIRCAKPAHLHLARRLLFSASALGHEEANILLISSGIRTGYFENYAGPLHVVTKMAKNGNPRAMTLLGRIAATNGNENEALEWFRKASQGPDGLNFKSSAETLVFEAQLLMQQDKERAREALQKAALELDDPSAYYYLATMEEKESLNRTVYFMKAAASGILEAAYELGRIELSKIKDVGSSNKSADHKMAREWFELAATGGHRESILELAKICKDNGELEEERIWRAKADDVNR